MCRTFRRRKYISPDIYREYVSYYDKETSTVVSVGYRLLEGAELKKALRLYHAENYFTYCYSAPKSHRKATSEKQRMLDKAELIKFSKNSDYEPMCFSKLPMEYWD